MRVKHPRAPTVRLPFQEARATLAALTFLRETKVWKMVTLAPPEEEWEDLREIALRPEWEEGQNEGEGEGRLGPP